ncbi:MAG TPA: hypothetical protein VNL17_03660 [Verrucomicrobiae bacterium]|nr:hypothetical protein [Verrucomicrobiae bacterium]
MKPNSVRSWCCGGLVVAAFFWGTTTRLAGEAAPTTSRVAKLTDAQMGEILQGAILLARMGLYDEAEQQCSKILFQDPKQPTVKQLLEEIQEKKRQQNSSSDLRHKLDATTIHELNVRDTTVTEVIGLLQADGQKVSGDKTPINFVWQAPEASKTARVTLNLHDIPLGDMLKYVTEGAGLRYRVDTHAIVIYKPLPIAPKESAPANVTFE